MLGLDEGQFRVSDDERHDGLERPADLFADLWIYRSPPPQSSYCGTIEEHRNFYSPQLDNRRTVLVYLPPSYHREPSRRYPVLYLQDGNNVFDTGTAFAGVDWHVDHAIERLSAQGKLPEIIAVGVFNTADRMAEYTPSWDPRFEGGLAEKYADFLIDQVKDFVDGNYRTLPEAAHTAIMGSSLGGLVSFWIGWRHPEVFSCVGAVSTSIWWDSRSLIDEVRREPDGSRNLRVWLDIGTYEGGDRDGDGVSDMVADSRDLRDLLLARGFSLHHNLEYFEDPGARHDELAWRHRVERPLQFFFGR